MISLENASKLPLYIKLTTTRFARSVQGILNVILLLDENSLFMEPVHEKFVDYYEKIKVSATIAIAAPHRLDPLFSSSFPPRLANHIIHISIEPIVLEGHQKEGAKPLPV